MTDVDGVESCCAPTRRTATRATSWSRDDGTLELPWIPLKLPKKICVTHLQDCHPGNILVRDDGTLGKP